MATRSTPAASYRDRDAWLEERRSGIGGSDAAAILGLSSFKTPEDVWMEKLGKAVEQEVTPPMKRGIHLEPIAAEVYVEETGRLVRRQPLVRHGEHKFILGNADRQILATSEDVDSTGVLELKCPGLYVMGNVKARGLPDYMIVQLMHYLGVYGYDWGSFGLFNAENWELIYFDLEADKALIDRIFEAEIEFWNKYVIPKVPPPEVVAEIEVPVVEGELKVIDDPEFAKAGRDLLDAKDLLKSAKDLEDKAKDRLMALMTAGELTAIEIPDIVRIKWVTGKPSTSWKQTAERLAKKGSLKLEDHVVHGKASRTFRSYLLKGE